MCDPGYILKNTPPSRNSRMQVIREPNWAGGTHESGDWQKCLVSSYNCKINKTLQRIQQAFSLTPQREEILTHMENGMSNKILPTAAELLLKTCAHILTVIKKSFT
jgi:hypothetical protein